MFFEASNFDRCNNQKRTGIPSRSENVGIPHHEADGGAHVAASRLAQEAKQFHSVGHRKTRDITLDFAAASSQLESGELVKDEFFTLFEAVGALEVGLGPFSDH